MTPAPRKLRVAYVYRRFSRQGSIESFYTRNAERLSHDEDVTAVCSSDDRASTAAPLSFLDVNPLVEGRTRFRYALECASFAVRAAAVMRQRRSEFDVIHSEGFATLSADLVSVHAVRPAEGEHYWGHVEPDAWLRRRIAPYLFRPQSGVVMAIERRLFRAGHRPYCITPTKAIKADLERIYGVPEHMVSVVPYGVETARFAPDAEARRSVRAELDVPEDRLAYLFVGDGFERKGLARAIAALAAASGDAELWVAGGTEDLVSEYRAHAVAGGVGERVRFLGRLPNTQMPRLYAAADVFVLLSQQDSWGHTVIESMASGRPVLISGFVGASEVVRDGENGYVVPGMGDPAAAAAIMDGPLADPEALRAMGERARRVSAAFDRDAIYPSFRDAHHLAHEVRLAREL